MTVETAALPPLAARLRGVRSSPVRDILALTQQPGVISFAGGLPAPELFDGPGTARRVRRRAARRGRRPHAAVLDHRGRPRAARRGRRAAHRPRPADARRRAADHERLAAGADADRDRAARAGRHRARRGAVLPRRAAGVPARRRDRRARAVRRRRDRPRGRGRARRAPRRPAALHDPHVPEPDRADAAARAPRGARRARARRRVLAAGGRPLRRAALPRRAARRSLGRGSTTACSRSRRCRRSPRPGCGSAGCARPSRCGGR